MKSYPGLPVSGCFIQTQYHVTYIPKHSVGLSTTVLADNSKITLSKASAIKTLSNIEDAYLFYL